MESHGHSFLIDGEPPRQARLDNPPGSAIVTGRRCVLGPRELHMMMKHRCLLPQTTEKRTSNSESEAELNSKSSSTSASTISSSSTISGPNEIIDTGGKPLNDITPLFFGNMAQNQALARATRRARNQHRYVFSLTNSRRQRQDRPTLSRKFDEHEFAKMANGKNHEEAQLSRWKRGKRTIRRMVMIGMFGMTLLLCMEGLVYSGSRNDALSVDNLVYVASKTKLEEEEKNGQQYLRGENNLVEMDARPRYSSGNVGNDIQQRVGRYAPVAPVNLLTSAEEQIQPNSYTNNNNGLNNAGQENDIVTDVANKVAELIKGGSKKLEDIKLVVSFDGLQQTSNTKGIQSSGLRPSPGKPIVGEDIQLDRQMKYKPSKHLLSRIQTSPHQIAGLHCTLYGGPSSNLNFNHDSVVGDLVYWQDIAADEKYMGPFFHKNQDMADDDGVSYKVARDSYSKYITFEPVSGGFNNNRMAFEMYLALSVAMGRTLVIPPKHKFALLNEGSEKEQILSMEDFFHLDSLNKENVGVNIITMEEFLRREASRGHFTRYASDEKMLPPHNETNWNAGQGRPLAELWNYLENIGYRAVDWNNGCVGAFPSDASGNHVLEDILDGIMKHRDGRSFPDPLDFQGRPVPLNSPPTERLREILAGRDRLCLYTKEMQDAPLIHFPSGNQDRLFMQFYSFVFFEDFRQSAWVLRLIRDHLRYKDVIMCAAARVIEAIREQSISETNPLGKYNFLHLRRAGGEFQDQYKETALSSEQIMNSLSSINVNSTLFVGTDEDRNHHIFNRLRETYKVVFLEDFQDLVAGLNPNFNGMIEQMIGARADTFFGTYYSTYSGYICRLRGYYNARDQKEGYAEGKLGKTYYITRQHENEYGIAKSVQKPFFAREFPIAWRGINRGISETSRWKT